MQVLCVYCLFMCPVCKLSISNHRCEFSTHCCDKFKLTSGMFSQLAKYWPLSYILFRSFKHSLTIISNVPALFEFKQDVTYICFVVSTLQMIVVKVSIDSLIYTTNAVYFCQQQSNILKISFPPIFVRSYKQWILDFL